MEVQFTSPDSEFCSQPIHYRPCLFGLVKSPMVGEEINELGWPSLSMQSSQDS